MKDVHIKVYDKQIYETHDDASETEFEGQLTFKNDSIFVTYKDDKMNVTTMIKVKDNVVSVKRLGSLSGKLVFDTQQIHSTIYYTQFGEMEIQIITKKCEVYILEKGVKIHIEYKIIMQGKPISDNIYLIVAN